VIEPNLAGATAIAARWCELMTSASTPAPAEISECSDQ
jgi:hypothetical protein